MPRVAGLGGAELARMDRATSAGEELVEHLVVDQVLHDVEREPGVVESWIDPDQPVRVRVTPELQAPRDPATRRPAPGDVGTDRAVEEASVQAIEDLLEVETVAPGPEGFPFDRQGQAIGVSGEDRPEAAERAAIPRGDERGDVRHRGIRGVLENAVDAEPDAPVARVAIADEARGVLGRRHVERPTEALAESSGEVIGHEREPPLPVRSGRSSTLSTRR